MATRLRTRALGRLATATAWTDAAGGKTIACTALVPPTIVEDPAAIMACPGIFQARQEKAYELRITVIGTQIFAAQITNTGANLDWRYDGDLIHFPLRVSAWNCAANSILCLAVSI